jgi:hypothetical protein
MAEVSDPRIFWLIKLHPREQGGDLWRQDIERLGIERVLVLQGGHDFYALLRACDIHASFASTTLVEAAALGKVNLGLSVERAPDPAGYSEAGAFVPVEPPSLGRVAAALLRNQDELARIRARQAAFAADWCLHDGKALQRIVETIERHMIGRTREVMS